MPFRKASVAVLVVLEGNERTALSDLKAFGIKTSHLIKAQAESAISLNLRVNGLNERGILKDPNAESELFDTFQQISRTDLLLVLRKKSDGKVSRRLWGFLETNKPTVVEEKGFEKGDSLLRWIARAGGFSAVVSGAMGGLVWSMRVLFLQKDRKALLLRAATKTPGSRVSIPLQK